MDKAKANMVQLRSWLGCCWRDAADLLSVDCRTCCSLSWCTNPAPDCFAANAANSMVFLARYLVFSSVLELMQVPTMKGEREKGGH
jgi:hypothetical protein